MVTLDYLERVDDPDNHRRTRLRLSEAGGSSAAARSPRAARWRAEFRERFGDAEVSHMRALLIDFVERHGAAEEIAAGRSSALQDTA